MVPYAILINMFRIFNAFLYVHFLFVYCIPNLAIWCMNDDTFERTCPLYPFEYCCNSTHSSRFGSIEINVQVWTLLNARAMLVTSWISWITFTDVRSLRLHYLQLHGGNTFCGLKSSQTCICGFANRDDYLKLLKTIFFINSYNYNGFMRMFAGII